MVRRAVVLLVAVLSASGPLTRGYCQFACMAASAAGQANAAGLAHSCHDPSPSGETLGPAVPACGHRSEIPVGPGTLAFGRPFSEDANHAIAATPPIVAVDGERVVLALQPSIVPHDRGRPHPDILRI